jgi:O-antigen/teichoic acid export membrane protein
VGGYAIALALSVVSAALLFRHLGVVDGGRYVTILSLVALVGGLSEGGLTALGVREFATRAPAERLSVLRALLGLRVVLTVAGVVAAVGFAVVAGYETLLIAGTAVAGLGLLIQSVQTAATVPLQAELRFGWVTLADLVRHLVTVGSIVALVITGAGLLAFLAVGVWASAAALALTVTAVRHRSALVPSFKTGRVRALAREGLPYAIATAVGAIYFRLAIIVMSIVATDVETGYFGASFRIVDVLIVIPHLLVGAAFPVFARAAHADRLRLAYAFERSWDGALIVGVWMAVVIAIGADFAIEVMAGAEFAPAGKVLRIQAAALLLVFVNTVLGYVLLSLKMYRALLATAGGALLTVGVLTPLLAEAHGAVGGAVATVACEAVVTGGALLALLRSHPDLRFPPVATLKILLAGAVALALAALDLPDVPAAVLASAVFAGALLALRAMPQELLDEARAVLRARR